MYFKFSGCFVRLIGVFLNTLCFCLSVIWENAARSSFQVERVKGGLWWSYRRTVLHSVLLQSSLMPDSFLCSGGKTSYIPKVSYILQDKLPSHWYTLLVNTVMDHPHSYTYMFFCFFVFLRKPALHASWGCRVEIGSLRWHPQAAEIVFFPLKSQRLGLLRGATEKRLPGVIVWKWCHSHP